MKVNRIAVIVSNKKGDCYQVRLSKDEAKTVEDFIVQLQGGKIRALKPKLSLTLDPSHPKKEEVGWIK